MQEILQISDWSLEIKRWRSDDAPWKMPEDFGRPELFLLLEKKNRLERERERNEDKSKSVDASFISGQFPEVGWSHNRPVNFV